VCLGGIGFDVADLLSHDEGHHSSTNVDEYLTEYVSLCLCSLLMCADGALTRHTRFAVALRA
jgi:hypothetical protein